MNHPLRHDPEKCRTRNVLAGLRGSVESTPIRFGGGTASVIAAKGSLPANPDAALILINEHVPGRKLNPDDVFLHQMEAASTRFVSDRSMFLHPSTLKNIVRDASNGGFAFMNSHRTGDLSTPSELPFGRAFAGAYQTVVDGEGGPKHKRAMLSVYMLRGVAPNGANGPTTDALSAAIDGGTIFDVSMGLYGGWRMCDLCGCDLKARDEDGNYACPHIPGTDRKVTKEQKAAQVLRGVASGVASYSLVDASPGEVSAVYDGAIPGAGFTKARRMLRDELLTRRERGEVLSTYPALARTLGTNREKHMPRMSLREWLGLAEQVATPGDDDEDALPERTAPARVVSAQYAVGTPLPPPPTTTSAPDPEVGRLREELDRLKASNRAESDARIDVDADRFARDLLASGRIVPNQAAHYSAAFAQAARDDRENPLADGDTRTSRLRKCGESNRDHGLTREVTVADAGRFRVLASEAPAEDDDAIKADRDEATKYALRMNGKAKTS